MGRFVYLATIVGLSFSRSIFVDAGLVYSHASLVLLKPEAVERGHVGRIVSELEDGQFTINEMSLVYPTRGQIRQHYSEHLDRDFYPSLEEYMLSGPVVALSISQRRPDGSDDPKVYERLRLLIGATDSRTAQPGTIRSRYGLDNQRNVIHASEDEEKAKREHRTWFPQCNWQQLASHASNAEERGVQLSPGSGVIESRLICHRFEEEEHLRSNNWSPTS